MCVWNSCLCVGGVGGRSVGPALSFLMPSSRNPLAGSIHATSVAASRVEQALSEVASSLQSSAPKQGPLHPWMTLAQIWLHAGTAPPPDWAPYSTHSLPQARASPAHGPSSRETRAFAVTPKCACSSPHPRATEDKFPDPGRCLKLAQPSTRTVFPFSHTPVTEFSL